MSWDRLLPPVVTALILAKWAASLWLERLNRRTVLAHADAVPEAFKGVMDETTYAKSVQYTLASARLSRVEITYDSIVLLVVLFSGVLPWVFGLFTRWLGTSAWAMAAFLCAVGVALALPSLPLHWYDQFRLEARFGFNTTTQKVWWMDRLKGLLLGLALGFPLLVLVMKLVGWMGPSWWLWSWGALLAFQLLLLVLAPVLIMPLFNKFTPLPEGSLRERLLKLAERTRFRTQSIQVMDGSKRSRHSNAFFTGFGSFRKIVLFDTLIEQLAEPDWRQCWPTRLATTRRSTSPRCSSLPPWARSWGSGSSHCWRGRPGSTTPSGLRRAALCRRCCCSGCWPAW